MPESAPSTATNLKDIKNQLDADLQQAKSALSKLEGRRPSWNVRGAKLAAERQISHKAAGQATSPEINNLTDYTCAFSAIRDAVSKAISHSEEIVIASIENDYSNYQEFYDVGGNEDTQSTVSGMKNHPDETLGLSETAIAELAPEAIKTVTQAAAEAAYAASHKYGFNIEELLHAQQATVSSSIAPGA